MLFNVPGKDPLYNLIRSRKSNLDIIAMKYWNQLYTKNQIFLDHDFSIELGNDFMGRLWELTISNYLQGLENKGVFLTQIMTQNSSPDFCFQFKGEKFYVEAVTSGPGTVASLQIPLNESLTSRTIPITKYKERITQALREKIIKKYEGIKGDGYKEVIDDSGLIIALSSGKIEIPNHPYNINLDLSCLFGFSDPILNINDAAYEYVFTPHFKKTTTGKPISTRYFVDPQFSYVSGIIISHHAHVFYPEFDESCNWPKCRNDFILIHNPLARRPIPRGIFPVAIEYQSSIENNQVTIWPMTHELAS